MKKYLCVILLLCAPVTLLSQVQVGLDRIFKEESFTKWVQGQNIALISHNSAINQLGENSLKVFLAYKDVCSLKVLGTLEHGFYGAAPAETLNIDPEVLGVHNVSLYGAKDLPELIRKECNLLVYDVQDIGVRSYTFVSALLFLVQSAEKYNLPLIILDRPNPLGGELVDGPLPTGGKLLPEIPYCYGMTPGELALFFKAKYAPKANVRVVPMHGWTRSMLFDQTGCVWIPTSPQIPCAETAFFYATTGIIGALSIINIGVGYTLPFKILGAPWMDSDRVVQELYKAKIPGIDFYSFSFEPFFGKFKLETCSGCLLQIQDAKVFYPVEMQCVLLGVIKQLYPKEYAKALQNFSKIPQRRNNLIHSIGSEKFLSICEKEPFIIWPLRSLCVEGREKFKEERQAFLIYSK